MGQVTVEINDKLYALGCADGDEERLTQLAQDVDTRVRDIRDKIGAVGETRLMLMAAILLAEERQSLAEGSGLELGHSDKDVATILDEIASQVESIAEELPTP